MTWGGEQPTQVYHELAQLYEREDDPQRRDLFLTLSADSAYAEGNTSDAEQHFRRLLSNSPHHFLGAYTSFAEAQGMPDGQMYLDDLRRQFPILKARKMLESKRHKERSAQPPSDSHQDLAENYRQSSSNRPSHPADEYEPMAQTQPEEPMGRTVPFVRPDSHSSADGTLFPTRDTPARGEAEDATKESANPQPGSGASARPGAAPQYQPTISEPIRSAPPQRIERTPKRRTPASGLGARGTQKPAFGPVEQRQPTRETKEPEPEPDDDPEMWRGEWLSVAFFVVLALAAAGLFFYTFLGPLFD